MIKTLLAVGIGGALGSIARFGTSYVIKKTWVHTLPWATFTTNILGCLMIGIFVGYFEKNNISESPYRWFLITGFCGGYTTFSTFALENRDLLLQNQMGNALLYSMSSVCLGILAVYFGLWLVSK